MPDYTVEIEGIGPVNVTKKRGMRSVRLRINPKGEVVVSAPWHVPKYVIEKFVQEKIDWIHQNIPADDQRLEDGVIIGNSTKLRISDGGVKNRSFFSKDILYLKLAGEYDPSNRSQNGFIEKKVHEALLYQAENTLLPRLFELAGKTGHQFNQAHVKRLTSRWGSCDSHKNIVLNIYLVQLPTFLQDYVILHELTHTVHMNHSSAFWKHMEEIMPSYKTARKILKTHRPRIYTKTV